MLTGLRAPALVGRADAPPSVSTPHQEVGRRQLCRASPTWWGVSEKWVVNELASSGRDWLLHRHRLAAGLLRHGTHQVAGILIQALDG